MESTNTDQVYSVGIDAGSKTIKVIMVDEDGKEVFQSYERHGTNIKETLLSVIHRLAWIKGDVQARIAVTGSAGIEVARLLGVPHVQEVIALTDAVKATVPDADVVIELGGEDSKIVYLTGGLEQRMNSTCAGGTGGFIDSIAYTLGMTPEYMGHVALGNSKLYPIASRCAVFAETDVRPLLNSGASKTDIAASVHEAVVRQTLGGLACGRPIRGKVVFLGGPFEFNRDLLYRFRKALKLDARTGVRPRDAHLFPALGAALAAKDTEPASLKAVEAKIAASKLGDAKSSIPCLPPLFEDEADIAQFTQAHDLPAFERAPLYDAHGPLYLGIDAGSTTSKIALVDAEGRLVYYDYQENEGDTVENVREMLMEMYGHLPRNAQRDKDHEPPYIAYACATGYGERILRAGFGVDTGVVETIAHATAANAALPGVSFMLDIGGQDMKALWIEDGQVVDAVLNEACSSGCGAFVSGTAHAVKMPKELFAQRALESKHPVDLGTKCTVFMSSKVKHAQKSGASVPDIAAGVAYSVVQNALFRIIGSERAAKLGDKIVVGGGTFKSDAILRAFELISGKTALRPREAHLMGAIGAALIARDRAQARSEGEGSRSTLMGADELKGLEIQKTATVCTGCQNDCTLSIMAFGGDRRYISGNKCEKGRVISEALLNDAPLTEEAPPDTFGLEQTLIASFDDVLTDSGVARIGILMALDQYEHTPFWHTLFAASGFDVIGPEPDCERTQGHLAWESVPAESICFPAKLAHARAFSVRDKGATHIFATAFRRGIHCPVATGYGAVLSDSVDFIREGAIQMIAPELTSYVPAKIAESEADLDALYEALRAVAEGTGHALDRTRFDEALKRALQAQRSFEGALEDAVDEALAWLEAEEGRRGILIAGRPYHADPALLNGIDEMLKGFGLAVIGLTGAQERARKAWRENRALEPFQNLWKPGKRMLRAAALAATEPKLELLCLQSFGCGYDAVSLNEAEAVMKSAGKTFTALKLDEMVDLSHIRIRLRTLADMLASAEEVAYASAEAKAPHNGAQPTKEAFPLSTVMDAAALMRARKNPLNDVCFTARAIAAKTTECALGTRLGAHPKIVLPAICQECLVDAVPLMAEAYGQVQAEYRFEERPTIQDFFMDDTVLTALKDEYASEGEGERPKIGIIGNALLCFDPLMNESVAALIASLGCTPVFPEVDALFVDEVTYVDQLKRFEEMGVRHVIYLQSFGCLKANSQFRGRIHALKEQFPTLSFNALDYDPESSELNRENRIRLVAQAAKTS